jgi:hypothetical protein
MAVKNANIFHPKALPNIPKSEFLVLKYSYHLATPIYTRKGSFSERLEHGRTGGLQF